MFEERYWYPDDGGQVWLAGYTPTHEGRYLGRDAPELAARGIRIAGVAGAAAHHAEALEQPRSARRSRSNATRPTSTTPTRSRCSRTATRSAGSRASSRLRSRRDIDAGRPWSAIALREQRESPRDPRTGLTMLLAPDAQIELRA